MVEKLTTRTDHSRSLEDAKRYRAIEVLKELGLLIPLTDIETYHGRVGTEEAEWSVDPTFANGSNDSGNYNVNNRPTLYTGELQIAKDFATQRAREYQVIKEHRGENTAYGYRAEIHEIVSHDSDATVLNSSFDDSQLDDESKEKYRQALRTLILPVTEGSPVSWEHRNDTVPFMTVLLRSNKYLVTKTEVKEMATESGVDESIALQLAGAYNSRNVALTRPNYLVNQLTRHTEDMISVNQEVKGKIESFPINLEYVQRYLREAHIVGVKQSISSATLGKDITSVSFFDLEKTTTDTGLKAERKSTWQKLGAIASSMDKVVHPKVEHREPLLRLLEDVHAKPKNLVEAARLVDGYNEIFDGDTGNWEGFTLAEHTETVLRNFDETFADKLPVELLAPMRLAILVHDMGKPLASSRGEKHRQKQYNVAQANDFLNKIGVDDRLKHLLIAIIGEGEELAFNIDIRDGGEPARKAMRQFAIQTLQTFNHRQEVTKDQVDGFVEMCKMLQICDGGAYTSIAVTRTKSAGLHRNSPSFNNSYDVPIGKGSRALIPKSRPVERLSR